MHITHGNVVRLTEMCPSGSMCMWFTLPTRKARFGFESMLIFENGIQNHQLFSDILVVCNERTSLDEVLFNLIIFCQFSRDVLRQDFFRNEGTTLNVFKDSNIVMYH